MQNIIISCLVIICALIWSANCAIPSYFNVCHRSDPQIGQCVTKAVYDLLPRLKVGIPEYDIPKIEPFQITDINFTTGSDSARVRAKVSKISAHGGSSFKIQEVSINPIKNIFRFKVIIPHLRLDGDIDVDAKILFLPIIGKGPMQTNITDFIFDCKLKANKIQRSGEEYLLFQKMQCLVQYKTIRVQMERLFENPALGRSTNDIINDNITVFADAMRPSLVDAVTNIFTDIANKIASKFSYNEFFPK